MSENRYQVLEDTAEFIEKWLLDETFMNTVPIIEYAPIMASLTSSLISMQNAESLTNSLGKLCFACFTLGYRAKTKEHENQLLKKVLEKFDDRILILGM